MNGETELLPSPEIISGETAGIPPATIRATFFERTDWLSFGITTALVMAVYWFTLAPEVGLWNSGIFATGARYAGVPHPPGFPVWTICGWLFIKLFPFGNIAWRLAVAVALAGALASGLVALMASRGGAMMLEGMRDWRRLEARQEKWLRIICGCAAGTGFGLDVSVWKRAVIVNDTWTLSLLLFAIVMCLLMRWHQWPEKTRPFYVAAFFYGLVLSNTQSMFMAAPGLLWLVLLADLDLGRDLSAVIVLLLGAGLALQWFGGLWPVYAGLGVYALLLCLGPVVKTRRLFTRWKTVLGCGFFLALALLFYFYPPVASMTNPPMNWGYPRTVEGFLHTITRGQYDQAHPTDSFARYGGQILLYAKMASGDLGPAYAAAAMIPFFFLHRMRAQERRWMFGLLGLFMWLSLFFLAMLNPENDAMSVEFHREYFTASHLAPAVWAGCGLILLGTILSGRKTRPVKNTV
jgi:Protein of unknown function (DUF2723)